MGTINPPIPKLGVTGSQPAQDIVDALGVIRDVLNGNLNAANLKDRGLDECPVPRWKEIKVTPNLMLCGGPYIPGLPPEYKFGPQGLGGPWPAAPAANVLREMAFTVKWSKSAKFGGGNDANNQMIFQMYNSEDQETGHLLTPIFGILVPGADGLRTAYKAGVVTTAPTLSPDFIYSTNAAVAESGQQVILPTVGDTVVALATGANGPFSGVFTLHEFVLRYRDWEF